jgi:hypothetical protein
MNLRARRGRMANRPPVVIAKMSARFCIPIALRLRWNALRGQEFMKTKLAIAAGILSFLAVIAFFGFLRFRQYVENQPLSAVIDEAPPPRTPEGEKQEKEQRERAKRERARAEAEKRAAQSARSGAGPAAPPPAPAAPPADASASVAPGAPPNPHLPAAHPRASATANAKPASSLEDVDAALQKLDWGQMAFDVPEKLRLEQTALIHLLISPTQTAEELTNAIREQTSEPVKIESARIQISGMMEAKLVGSAFEINPITPEDPQMVSRTEPTEWKWEIRPRQAGRQSLHLTLNAIIRFDEKERPRVVRTFDRVIQVDVAVAQSKTPWRVPVAIVAAALFALGLGAMVYRLFQRRKRVAVASSAAMPLNRPNDGEAVDLFLSYSRRDEARVLPLVEKLRASGLAVWMDQSGIDGATLWAQEITDAIRRAKICLLFASAASFGSKHVARELSLAVEEGKPILPLHLEPVETPSTLRYQLAGIQHIILYEGDTDANFQLILRALTRLGTQLAP